MNNKSVFESSDGSAEENAANVRRYLGPNIWSTAFSARAFASPCLDLRSQAAEVPNLPEYLHEQSTHPAR